MRSMYQVYTDLKKDYYLVKASECLAKAGKYLGTNKFNVWMELYNEYMNKAIDLYS